MVGPIKGFSKAYIYIRFTFNNVYIPSNKNSKISYAICFLYFRVDGKIDGKKNISLLGIKFICLQRQNVYNLFLFERQEILVG